MLVRLIFSRADIHMVTVQRAQIAIVGEKHTSVRHDRVKSFASRWTAEGGVERFELLFAMLFVAR